MFSADIHEFVGIVAVKKTFSAPREGRNERAARDYAGGNEFHRMVGIHKEIVHDLVILRSEQGISVYAETLVVADERGAYILGLFDFGIHSRYFREVMVVVFTRASDVGYGYEVETDVARRNGDGYVRFWNIVYAEQLGKSGGKDLFVFAVAPVAALVEGKREYGYRRKISFSLREKNVHFLFKRIDAYIYVLHRRSLLSCYGDFP